LDGDLDLDFVRRLFSAWASSSAIRFSVSGSAWVAFTGASSSGFLLRLGRRLSTALAAFLGCLGFLGAVGSVAYEQISTSQSVTHPRGKGKNPTYRFYTDKQRHNVGHGARASQNAGFALPDY
jgi:hypothetical protein